MKQYSSEVNAGRQCKISSVGDPLRTQTIIIPAVRLGWELLSATATCWLFYKISEAVHRINLREDGMGGGPLQILSKYFGVYWNFVCFSFNVEGWVHVLQL